MSGPFFHNIEEWLKENSQYFLPPVCNKMMHSDGQCKVFFVGGPNQRKDFHLDRGEEFFYMRKGDMCLKIVERGVHKDIIIREGEVFLLPGCIPHSPQRKADTVGLVIERERLEGEEIDGLRYYVEEPGDKPTTEILYEEWFYCDSLGSLGPIIKRFFNTEQYKTGKPTPGFLSDEKPMKIDESTSVDDPFCLDQWLSDHSQELDTLGSLPLFQGQHQTSVRVCGKGTYSDVFNQAEVFMWQKSGSSCVTVDDKETRHLSSEDSLLIPLGARFTMSIDEAGSRAILIAQSTPSNPVDAHKK